MRYLALVADYDGTLASHDTVTDEAVRAIERLRTSGRRAILVTGRRLHDLLAVFAHTHVFDLIVAENGAVVYDPATREEVTLANPPSKHFLRKLRTRGVQPLEIGQVVVATLNPHRATVQDVLGLSRHEVVGVGQDGGQACTALDSAGNSTGRNCGTGRALRSEHSRRRTFRQRQIYLHSRRRRAADRKGLPGLHCRP